MSLVETWLTYLDVERGRAPNTIATYARTMRTLPGAETATRTDVEDWWRSRADRSRATRNNELAAVRGFYKWCVKYEHRPDDPSARLDPLGVDKTLPRPISRADLGVLFTRLDGEMRRAICLLAYTGMRVSEAAAADWSHVDLENARLRVTGKGRKTRLVGLGPLLVDAILPDTGGNIVTGGGRVYSAAHLQQKLNRAIKAAGVDATCHMVRHRFGTVALAATGNLLSVSRAMGHESPATTAIYAATSDADLDVIAEAVAR